MTAATGFEVPITFNGRPARAWVPATLHERDVTPDVATVRGSERAVGSVLRLGDRLAPTLEPLARLLLRAEGVASSNIEGLRAPIEDVAVASVEPDAGSSTAAWVADNLAVVDACLAHAATAEQLDEDVLHGWHRRLMRHGDLDAELVGRFRDRQGWIGGYGPQSASYVPPPADEIGRLMDDLLGFVNGHRDDAVTRGALAHAQFEAIHPYGDGNGRIGRLVVLWVLARDLGVATPPPVSALIARDPGGYLSGLHTFRTNGTGPWVRWFAGVVEDAAAASMEWATSGQAVLDGWRRLLDDLRADATARRVIDVLAEHLVVSADLVAAALGVSDTAARAALVVLCERGVIAELQPGSPSSRGRPRRWWIASELAALTTSWSG